MPTPPLWKERCVRDEDHADRGWLAGRGDGDGGLRWPAGRRRRSWPGGRLTIATGNTTGVYYVLGGGLAKIISSDLEGYKATAEATKASKENVERVVAGQNDIAFSLADTAADAAKGENSFTEKQPIRALMRIYDNTTQVVVRTGTAASTP